MEISIKTKKIIKTTLLFTIILSQNNFKSLEAICKSALPLDERHASFFAFRPELKREISQIQEQIVSIQVFFASSAILMFPYAYFTFLDKKTQKHKDQILNSNPQTKEQKLLYLETYINNIEENPSSPEIHAMQSGFSLFTSYLSQGGLALPITAHLIGGAVLNLLKTFIPNEQKANKHKKTVLNILHEFQEEAQTHQTNTKQNRFQAFETWWQNQATSQVKQSAKETFFLLFSIDVGLFLYVVFLNQQLRTYQNWLKALNEDLESFPIFHPQPKICLISSNKFPSN
jgi:hypothetical protein